MDRNDRTLRSFAHVLLVFVRKQLNGAFRLSAVGDHARSAVGANPPELAPVVFVVVGENRDSGIGRDILQALEVRRLLWFRVDREVERISVDGKNNRHDVRPSLFIYRREASDHRVGKPLHRFCRLHAVKCGRCPISRAIVERCKGSARTRSRKRITSCLGYGESSRRSLSFRRCCPSSRTTRASPSTNPNGRRPAPRIATVPSRRATQLAERSSSCSKPSRASRGWAASTKDRSKD